MARKLDKNGERTIGVLTKVDLMDRGTNAMNVLRNEEVVLRYGYVAVKGRSSAEVRSGMTIAEGTEKEREYFENHPDYSTLDNPRETLGVGALTLKLTTILNKHIKKNLPGIVQGIKDKIESWDTRLHQLGIPLPGGNEAKMQIVWGMINDYIESYKNTIKGKYSKIAKFSTDEEPIGASMRKSFLDLFSNFTDNKKDLSDYLTDKMIEQAFINYEGNAFPGFPSFGGFLSLLHPFIDKLYEPISKIIDDAFYNLENASKGIVEHIFSRYPALEEIVTDLSGKILGAQRDTTKKMCQDMLDSERGYIFTSDSEYVISFGKLLPPPCHQSANSEEKKLFIKEVRLRITKYLCLSLRNLRDFIPKIIGQILINKSLEKLQMEVLDGINKNKEIMDSLNEPEHVRLERETLTKAVNVLRKAQKKLMKEGIINDDADY